MSGSRSLMSRTRWGALVLLGAATVLQPAMARTVAAASSGNDWSQYLFNGARNGFTDETLINTANAGNLTAMAGWPVSFDNGAVCPSTNDYCSSSVVDQPTIATVDGSTLVFVGTWQGSEYALCASSCTIGASTYTSGQAVWSTYIGRTSGCGGPTNSRIAGLTDAAAYNPAATVNHGVTPVIYVGAGGDIAQDGSVMPSATTQLYALNAVTGAVIWQTSLGPAPKFYMWSSPLFANGSIYVGLASDDDCPLVSGGVMQLDPNTGAVLNTFSTVPSGCTGASVWGSPSVDASGDIYIATGNPGTCSQAEPYAVAVVKLSSTLNYISSWAVPTSQQVSDSDFGNTPTLFAGTVTSTGPLRTLIGVANKNGLYYVFDAANIGSGPIKKLRVAGGGSDPETGGGSISPSSYDGKYIYVAGGKTTINKVKYMGSVRAYNPNRLGRGPVWQVGFTAGPVLAAVTTDPGLAIVSDGAFMNVIDTSNGTIVNQEVASGFYGAAAIAYGVIYEGDTAQIGELHAYSAIG